LKTVVDWIKGSGWVQALIQVDFVSPGVADSLLQVTHVVRTRRAHQITVAALYILKCHAYDHYCLTSSGGEHDLLDFQQWSDHIEEFCPHFQYRIIVMELEFCILIFVRSLCVASFEMYFDSMTSWLHGSFFFALDHTNYACWIPVHLKDMTELPNRQPNVANCNGNFMV